MSVFYSVKQKQEFMYWLRLAKLHWRRPAAYRQVCLSICRQLIDPDLEFIDSFGDELMFKKRS